MGFDKLELLANQNKVSFYKVSKDTGISTVTFSHWKNGKYKPKIDKLLILAKYFDVPVEYFLEE